MDPNATPTVERFRHWADAQAPGLAQMGGGATPARLAALAALARADVAAARLGEAHADALAIHAEAGRTVPPGSTWGVWAAEPPDGRLEATRVPGGWSLAGVKRWCSGACLVTHALVTAHGGDLPLLVAVDLAAPGITVDPGGWAAPAFASTTTATVRFDAVVVPVDAVLGGPGWYLDRPGFWHGAVAVAACWAGGALGLVDDAEARVHVDDPHAAAHLGALRADAWALTALLDAAGREIDAARSEGEVAGGGRRRALALRHLVEERCHDVVDRFGRALGPAPLAMDASVARRVAEVQLYVRQSHAERDLAVLGRMPGATPSP